MLVVTGFFHMYMLSLFLTKSVHVICKHQPVQPGSLINNFVTHSLNSIIPIDAIVKLSRLS